MRIVASERSISMLHSEGCHVRIVVFRVVSGVSSEDSAQTDGDFVCCASNTSLVTVCFFGLHDRESCDIELRLSCVVVACRWEQYGCLVTAVRSGQCQFEVCHLLFGVVRTMVV